MLRETTDHTNHTKKNTKQILVAICIFASTVAAQSGRVAYSESGTEKITARPTTPRLTENVAPGDADVVRVQTDLVTIPVRIATRGGKPVPNVKRTEFQIFENGVPQEIAYFSNEEQPFTVALILDMSYSSVFKLDEIQAAARIFTFKLREHDRVMVVSFAEKPMVLCEPTNDRRILRLAIDGAQIASGTALYDTLDMVVTDKLATIPGRRAIVLLSDGVDTSSSKADTASVAKRFAGEDVIVYTLRYNTFDDVRKSAEKNAQVLFDENDRPYVVRTAPKKGEREQDYEEAQTFLKTVSEETGGRVYKVSSTTNLNDAFSNIADELRKIYSIGYYPAEDRQSGAVYDIKVRVYRPDLKITARNQYFGR